MWFVILAVKACNESIVVQNESTNEIKFGVDVVFGYCRLLEQKKKNNNAVKIEQATQSV